MIEHSETCTVTMQKAVIHPNVCHPFFQTGIIIHKKILMLKGFIGGYTIYVLKTRLNTTILSGSVTCLNWVFSSLVLIGHECSIVLVHSKTLWDKSNACTSVTFSHREDVLRDFRSCVQFFLRDWPRTSPAPTPQTTNVKWRKQNWVKTSTVVLAVEQVLVVNLINVCWGGDKGNTTFNLSTPPTLAPLSPHSPLTYDHIPPSSLL